jgi:hypothetical protein
MNLPALRTEVFDLPAADAVDATSNDGQHQHRFRVEALVVSWTAPTMGDPWEFFGVSIHGHRYRADGTVGVARTAGAYYPAAKLAAAPDWVQQRVLDETKALVNR